MFSSKSDIAELRASLPKQLAQELLSVQPIDPKPFQDLYKLLAANPNAELVLTATKLPD